MAWLFAPGDDLLEAVAGDVDLSASAPWAVAKVADAAARTGRAARLHLKVDTGLGRAGAPPARWPELLDAALAHQAAGRVHIVGLWSHLASADEPDRVVTGQQREVFEEAVAVAAQRGIEPEVRHLASTGATVLAPESHYELVRCGIGIYGLSPGAAMGSSADLGLRPAMSVHAEVASAKRVPAGHGVSYGLRYRTSAEATLALIPVGYADGIPRAGSGRIPLRIGGQGFQCAGTIAMDQFVVDAGDAQIAPGDPVVLFGSAPGPTADDWAQACGTINYEIVTRLGSRIPRRYFGGEHAGP
jgi:alanine racemase